MLSINPSETIWTILCFLALLFLLDRFLYKPLVRFMDERKARVEAGLDEEAQAQAALDEDARGLERERQLALQEAGEKLKAEKLLGEERRAEAVRKAKQAAADAADRGRAEAEVLRAETERELSLRRDDLAETLAEHLLKTGNTEQ